MTVITKKGDLNKVKSKLEEFVCPGCGCEFKTNEYDIRTYEHSRRITYVSSCPYCKKVFLSSHMR